MVIFMPPQTPSNSPEQGPESLTLASVGPDWEATTKSDQRIREEAWIAVRLAVRAHAREPTEHNASRVQRTWDEIRFMEEQAIQMSGSSGSSKILFGPKPNPADEGEASDYPAVPSRQHCSAQ